MKPHRNARFITIATLFRGADALLAGTAAAQSAQVQGVINVGRGPDMTVQTDSETQWSYATAQLRLRILRECFMLARNRCVSLLSYPAWRLRSREP